MKRSYGDKGTHAISDYLRSKGYQSCEYIESHGSEYILPNVTLGWGNIIKVFMSLRPQVLLSHEQNFVSLYDFTIYYNYCPTIVHYGNEPRGYLDVQVSGIGAGGDTGTLDFSEKVDFLSTFDQQNGTYLDIINQSSRRVQVLHSIPANSQVQLLTYILTDTYKKAECKLYKCEITKNDEMIRDLYPVYNISSGISGLYDMVSDSFFGNNGSGSFTHGTDIEI